MPYIDFSQFEPMEPEHVFYHMRGVKHSEGENFSFTCRNVLSDDQALLFANAKADKKWNKKQQRHASINSVPRLTRVYRLYCDEMEAAKPYPIASSRQYGRLNELGESLESVTNVNCTRIPDNEWKARRAEMRANNRQDKMQDAQCKNTEKRVLSGAHIEGPAQKSICLDAPTGLREIQSMSSSMIPESHLNLVTQIQSIVPDSAVVFDAPRNDALTSIESSGSNFDGKTCHSMDAESINGDARYTCDNSADCGPVSRQPHQIPTTFRLLLSKSSFNMAQRHTLRMDTSDSSYRTAVDGDHGTIELHQPLEPFINMNIPQSEDPRFRLCAQSNEGWLDSFTLETQLTMSSVIEQNDSWL